MQGRGSQRSWCGEDVSSIGCSRNERRSLPSGCGQWNVRCARCAGLARTLFGGLGELHGPGALLAGVDLEEAGAVEAARKAILGAADGELFVARAHVGLTGPFAATVVVDRVDVIEA